MAGVLLVLALLFLLFLAVLAGIGVWAARQRPEGEPGPSGNPYSDERWSGGGGAPDDWGPGP